jgi:phosphoribosylanthranilate isomerase
MRVKICGITNLEQARAIASLGAQALGFICVPSSPRHVEPAQIKEIVRGLRAEIAKIGVFVNGERETIKTLVEETGLTGVQLHGEESPEFCQRLQELLPLVELIKAIRVKSSRSLDESQSYFNCVDALLLDAYHPQIYGGTGKTLSWKALAKFNPPLPWLLAGGLRPDNILSALEQLKPDGIDLSSGVERWPGNKDLGKVAQLFEQLQQGGYSKSQKSNFCGD